MLRIQSYIKNHSVLIRIIFFFIIYITFFLKCLLTLDPDFGWHIRMGQVILKNGIPRTDPLSYSMGSYPFIDHEWLTNVILAKLYPIAGMVLPSILFSLIMIVPLLIQNFFTSKNKNVLFSFLILETGVFLYLGGVRPQVLDWSCVAILTSLLINSTLWKKYRLFLPVLFIFWVNLHGGFAIGIFILTLFITTKLIFQKNRDFIDLIILTTCFIATLITPYGIGNWKEVFNQLSDSSLHWSINEWLPTVTYPQILSFWIFLAISVFMVFNQRKHFSIPVLCLYSILLLLGLSSLRHSALWVVFALPVTREAVNFFSVQIEKFKYGPQRFLIISRYLLGVCIGILALQMFFSNPFYPNELFYPKKAINYLRIHPFQGNLFSSYGWGGYLDWQFPSKKVFIDGRMPSWRRKSSSTAESDYAFIDYEKIISGDADIRKLIKKYQITRVLLPTQDVLYKPNAKETKVRRFLLSFLPKEISKQFLSDPVKLQKQLKDAGFVKIYQDSVAVIFEKR